MTGWRATRIILCTYAAVSLFVWLATDANAVSSSSTILDDNTPRRKSADYSWNSSNALARSALVERQERLQYNCDEVSGNSDYPERVLVPDDFRNLLVDDKHELLYCYVPKVACTNWKRVLMIATGKWPGSDPLEIPADMAHSATTFQRLSNFTMPEIEQKLASYDTLIVVRHPLERLLSAYRNKLETKDAKSPKYFQTRFGRRIVKKYRPNATRESLTKGDDVTFREFVDFITNEDEQGTRNEHWIPISELCLPCTVNYNLVSKYESLDEDATEVLERIGSSPITFPTRPQSSEPTSKKLDRYYSTLSFKQLRKLADFYRLDLRLFDYSLEDVLGFSLA